MTYKNHEEFQAEVGKLIDRFEPDFDNQVTIPLKEAVTLVHAAAIGFKAFDERPDFVNLIIEEFIKPVSSDTAANHMIDQVHRQAEHVLAHLLKQNLEGHDSRRIIELSERLNWMASNTNPGFPELTMNYIRVMTLVLSSVLNQPYCVEAVDQVVSAIMRYQNDEIETFKIRIRGEEGGFSFDVYSKEPERLQVETPPYKGRVIASGTIEDLGHVIGQMFNGALTEEE